MQCLSRTLERVRAAFRRRTPGRLSRPAMPQEAPQAPPARLAPDVWGARLVTARRHRKEWHTPHVEPRAAWEHTGALVRPYVAALGAPPGDSRTGAQGNPWEAAR
jgi:hypothetical protein